MSERCDCGGKGTCVWCHGRALDEAAKVLDEPDHRVELAEMALSRWTFADGSKLEFALSDTEDRLRGHPDFGKPPLLDGRVCETCGANDKALMSTHHAGWVCLDVRGCLRRAGEKEAQEINAWVDSLPSDIHPTGRCTCAGEGRCAWCQEICQHCMGNCLEYPCAWCNGTGYADGLDMSSEQRAAKVEAIRADDADYEALGYRETEDSQYIGVGGLESLADSIDLTIGSFMGDVYQRVNFLLGLDNDADIRSAKEKP